MPYIRKGKCVHKKGGKKIGCSDSAPKAKKYLKKLQMVEEEQEFDINTEIENYLAEAARDAKVLRNINIDYIKKEVPMDPEEKMRDYFARIQQMEKDPDYANPVFHQKLVTWVDSLPDTHFPNEGRKRFAKWLGNAINFEETEGDYAPSLVHSFSDLTRYTNEVRYIVDYLNGSADLPQDLWNLKFNQMLERAQDWHNNLNQPERKLGSYEGKTVVYKFNNGFTIVDVDTQNDLEVEGDIMGHCVGSYCDNVAAGVMTIYSLRSKNNKPHATIEVLKNGLVQQIKGNANTKPKERYRLMIRQWLETTDFNYKNSPDYINLLSKDEVKHSLINGDLSMSIEQNLLLSTADSEILNIFLDQITNPENKINLPVTGIINQITRNLHLSDDHKMRLMKINLQLPQPELGRRVSGLLGIHNKNPDGALANRLWQETRDTLKDGVLDEKLYYMEAIMTIQDVDQEIKEEILDHITGDDYISKATGVGKGLISNLSLAYGAILQQYLFSRAPSSLQVKKLYQIQQNKEFLKLLGQTGRLNGYIASSRALNDDIVALIIQDVKDHKPWQLNQRDWMDIIENPRVGDSMKIQLLNIGWARSIANMMRTTEDGLKWYMTGRSLSRRFVEGSAEKKYSKRFVKYLIDGGFFDPEYVNKWATKIVVNTGKRPPLESTTGAEKEEILAAARKSALTDFEMGVFDEDVLESQEPKTVSTSGLIDGFNLLYADYILKEDIEDYFSKGGEQ